MSSIGPIWLACASAAGLGRLPSPRRKAWLRLSAAAGGALLLAYAALTWRQSSLYQDRETLFRDNIRRNPRAWYACNNLGYALGAQNRHAEAFPYFEKALAQAGRITEGIAEFREALRLRPGYTAAQKNLQKAQTILGASQSAQ